MFAKPSFLRSATLGVAACFLLAACSAPNSSFYNRGTPESLLDISSEVVTLSVRDKADLDTLANWIEKDHPTRADLQCDGNMKPCQAAVKILEDKDVNVALNPSPNNSVTLYYERIVARDCNQRYVLPDYGRFDTTPPSFGCSISANMVQQVSDKQEFVNPAISDDPSPVWAVGAYRRAMTPAKQGVDAYDVGKSATSNLSAGGS